MDSFTEKTNGLSGGMVSSDSVIDFSYVEKLRIHVSIFIKNSIHNVLPLPR